MTYDLTGEPLATTRQRARRKVALDPTNPKTWHESDAQERLKARLRLGGWIAWHVRKQGHREAWGREHEGIIESVPSRAAWGVLDWVCIPSSGSWADYHEGLATVPENIVWVELKSEKGKLTEEQAQHALWLARAGQEVAVLRPRHFCGNPDLAAIRFVDHRRPPKEWSEVLVQPEWDVATILQRL
jgi:hypothetical protein